MTGRNKSNIYGAAGKQQHDELALRLSVALYGWFRRLYTNVFFFFWGGGGGVAICQAISLNP